MGKMAIITVELVDESFAHSNGAIMEELFQGLGKRWLCLGLRRLIGLLLRVFRR